MSDWNLGSVAERVWWYVDTMPTATSGNLTSIANNQLQKITDWTGETIGSNSIPVKYQNPVLYFTIADIQCIKADVGTDSEEIKLGDFKIKKGSNSSASDLCAKYTEKAETELLTIGRKSGYKQVFG